MSSKLARKIFRVSLRIFLLFNIFELVKNSPENSKTFAQNFEKIEKCILGDELKMEIDLGMRSNSSPNYIYPILKKHSEFYFVRICFVLMVLVVSSFSFRFFLIFVGLFYFLLEFVMGDFLNLANFNGSEFQNLLKVIILSLCAIAVGFGRQKRVLKPLKGSKSAYKRHKI